jgi:hypothetical protein
MRGSPRRVLDEQAILFQIYKNRQNVTERNAVLFDIDPVLFFVPFELHNIVATFVVTNKLFMRGLLAAVIFNTEYIPIANE